MNCAIYARVSTADQIKGYSISSQLEAGRAFAAKRDWTVVAEYTDPARSGTDDQRPEFQKMIKNAVTDGKFEAVIVYSFDRFARNIEHAVLYKGLLRRKGVQIFSVMEPLDAESPLAFIHEGIIDLFAAFYSVNLSAKIREGHRKAVADGRWIRKPPMGYIMNNGWVEVAEIGSLITQAFKEFATGQYTLGTWADTAYTQLGLTDLNGQRITPSHWARIFHNRFYLGMVSWNGQEAVGQHHPLVDQETFEQVQTILSSRNHPRQVYRFNLLREFCYSLDADDIMTGATGGGHRYYRSRHKSGRPYHHVPADILEDQIQAVLQTVAVDGNKLGQLVIDDAMQLAFRVAPNMGIIYQWLESNEQRRALLKLVVAEYGLKVKGQRIVDLEVLPPFFRLTLDLNKVELRGIEPLTS